jgi:hypothetical protein
MPFNNDNCAGPDEVMVDIAINSLKERATQETEWREPQICGRGIVVGQLPHNFAFSLCVRFEK